MFTVHLSTDISKSKNDAPVQPNLNIFPTTLMGDRRRCFRQNWYTLHPWLEYSVIMDSTYCYACRHFSTPKAPDTVFVSTPGFRNWKNATMRKAGFSVHAKSERHKCAMIAWRDYQSAVKNDATLADILNKEHTKQVQENRAYIKTIGEVLLLTATQNIAQRGHDESEESNNKGNFREILSTVANHDPLVKRRLTSINNAKYTSKIIQNEVLGCLAEKVCSEIIEEVKNSEVFSIMADETKDVSKSEQISAERLDAASLTGKIVNLLESYGLNYKNNLVGQAYDGAAVMSGKHSGVQARIKEQAKFAFYIHCSAHCLNLVLVDVVKNVPETEEFFSLLQSLYIFTSGSYVHPKWLSLQKEMYGKTRELQRLSDTRWACRFLALRNIMDTLPALKRLLQQIAQERHGERTVEARGLLPQIDLQFVVHLVTLSKLFAETKLLSDMLQSQTVDLARAVDLVNALVQTLKDHRQESFFDKLWDEALTICEHCDSAPSVAKRQTMLSTRLSGYCTLSTVGQREVERDKAMFCTSFFYPVIDSMLKELNRRFSNTNCELMTSIQSLNPQSDAFLKETNVFSFGRLYNADIDDLGHELHQFKRVLDRKIQSGEITKPCNTVELVCFIEPYREVFFELFRLCKIAVTLPVSSASCERSFSTLKLIKTFLRSTTTDMRLSDLGVLSIESRRAKALDLDAFVDRFARQHNRRILLL